MATYYVVSTLKLEIGRFVPASDTRYTTSLEAASARLDDNPGYFIYEADRANGFFSIQRDVTPVIDPPQKSWEYDSLNHLIKTDDLAAYQIGARARADHRSNPPHTKTKERSEKLFELLKAAFDAERRYEEVMEAPQNANHPIYDPKDFAAEHLEVRNRLVNALGELLGQ